jgi:hypothetical protein
MAIKKKSTGQRAERKAKRSGDSPPVSPQLLRAVQHARAMALAMSAEGQAADAYLAVARILKAVEDCCVTGEDLAVLEKPARSVLKRLRSKHGLVLKPNDGGATHPIGDVVFAKADDGGQPMLMRGTVGLLELAFGETSILGELAGDARPFVPFDPHATGAAMLFAVWFQSEASEFALERTTATLSEEHRKLARAFEQAALNWGSKTPLERARNLFTTGLRALGVSDLHAQNALKSATRDQKKRRIEKKRRARARSKFDVAL